MVFSFAQQDTCGGVEEWRQLGVIREHLAQPVDLHLTSASEDIAVYPVEIGCGVDSDAYMIWGVAPLPPCLGGQQSKALALPAPLVYGTGGPLLARSAQVGPLDAVEVSFRPSSSRDRKRPATA